MREREALIENERAAAKLLLAASATLREFAAGAGTPEQAAYVADDIDTWFAQRQPTAPHVDRPSEVSEGRS